MANKRTVTGGSIKTHPDREQIIEKLMDGISVRGVESWLSKKYPPNSSGKKHRLAVSYNTLQAFRTNFLNLSGDILEEVQRQKSERNLAIQRKENKALIAKSEAYQEGKRKIATDIIDRQEEIGNLHGKLWTLIHFLEKDIDNGKAHLKISVIVELLREARMLLTDYDKMMKDQEKQNVGSVNVQITQVQEYQQHLRNAVIDTFRETNPELLAVFLDKLRDKMNQTDNSSQEINVAGVQSGGTQITISGSNLQPLDLN